MNETIIHYPQFKMKALGEEMQKDSLPPFVIASTDPTQSASVYLHQCNQVIQELTRKNYSPTAVHAFRSRMMDQLIVELLNFFIKEPGEQQDRHNDFALIATGGYGRQEMSVLSDLDLLFLAAPGLTVFCEKVAQKILYVLWDLKFDVGHAIRTVSECLEYVQNDHTIMTALLDMRLIVGNEVLFEKLRQEREALLEQAAFSRQIFLAKIEERETRLNKYGDTVYLLEPHIKEGEGGLRDLHVIRWLSQILRIPDGFFGLQQADLIDKQTCDELSFALNFYLRLRNKLHLLLCRKSDQINFDAQIVLAREMGFDDDDVSLGVEKFMQSYYTVGTQVNRHVKTLIQKMAAQLGVLLRKRIETTQDHILDEHFQLISGQILHRQDSVFQTDLLACMSLFLHVQNTGLDIHFSTRDLILKALPDFDEACQKDPGVSVAFKRLMGHWPYLGKTLLAMHEIHFLETLIPEFKSIRNRRQHDVYHVYTVDTHSLFAVNQLSLLVTDARYAEQFPVYKETAEKVKRRDLLSFALLFHDIGKGIGGDHSVKGAEMADAILMRLGYQKADRETVEFLVRSHLIMSHLSQRRDLQDIHMLTEFAQAVKSLDRLYMLFVLTWADIRAVNTDAWTEWKDTLLQSLYQKTVSILSEESSAEAFVKEKVADMRTAVLKRMKHKVNETQLEIFLQSISPRYVLAHKDDEILRHFQLISEHDDLNLLFEEREIRKGLISEILIYTLSNPRVIPLVTGVMLALGINILTMENFVLTDGHVLIKMRVQTGHKESLKKAGYVELLKQNLYEVFRGNTNIRALIKKHKPAHFLQKKPVQKAKTEIHVDNDVSAYYTIIDVLTHDRLGLLYDIVNCLVNQGCYVELSKISTKVEQVVDTLYVKDIFGQKITSKNKLEDIKRVLYEVIDG